MDRSTAPITDTLEFAEELERVGMERQQARVVARGTNGTLVTHFATKADVARVGSKVAETKAELSGKISEVEGKVVQTKAELKTDIAGVPGKVSEVEDKVVETKAELNTEIAGLSDELAAFRARLDLFEARLLRLFLGGALLASVVSASIVKFL